MKRMITVMAVLLFMFVGLGTANAAKYRVVKGDCLSKIGQKLHVSWRQTAELNNIKAPKYKIYRGQWLEIPAKFYWKRIITNELKHIPAKVQINNLNLMPMGVRQAFIKKVVLDKDPGTEWVMPLGTELRQMNNLTGVLDNVVVLLRSDSDRTARVWKVDYKGIRYILVKPKCINFSWLSENIPIPPPLVAEIEPEPELEQLLVEEEMMELPITVGASTHFNYKVPSSGPSDEGHVVEGDMDVTLVGTFNRSDHGDHSEGYGVYANIYPIKDKRYGITDRYGFSLAGTENWFEGIDNYHNHESSSDWGPAYKRTIKGEGEFTANLRFTSIDDRGHLYLKEGVYKNHQDSEALSLFVGNEWWRKREYFSKVQIFFAGQFMTDAKRHDTWTDAKTGMPHEEGNKPESKTLLVAGVRTTVRELVPKKKVELTAGFNGLYIKNTDNKGIEPWVGLDFLDRAIQTKLQRTEWTKGPGYIGGRLEVDIFRTLEKFSE